MTAAAQDPTPSEAEAEAERVRAELASTIQQLRENLKPASVADEVLVHARSTGSAVGEQVWDVARRNPLSAVLIGAGAAVALGLGGKAVSPSRAPRPASETDDDPEGSIAGANPQRHSFGGSDLLDIANDAMRLVARRTRTALTRTQHGSTPFQETTMTGNSHPRARVQHALSRAIDEQPLVLAVLGLAAGAALGALMPKTDAENSLLGERAEALRAQARSVAQDKVETLRAAAAHAVEDIKQTASEHGVSSENLSGLVHDVGAHAKQAAYEAGRGLDPTS